MAVDVAGLLSLAVLALLILGPLAWVVWHYAVIEDLRTASRVLRIDVAGAVAGVLLAAGCVVAVVLLWTNAAPLSGLFAITLLALGTAGLAVAVANADWYLASRRLPVTDPEDAAPGPIQLEGRAVPIGDLVPSSVTKTEAVAYRASTREERAVLGRGYAGSTWAAVSIAENAVPFGVVELRADAENEEESDDGTEGYTAGKGDDAADGTGTGGVDEGTGQRDQTGRQLPDHLRAELEGPDESLADVTAALTVDGPAAEYPLLYPTSRLVHTSPAATTLEGLERAVPAEPGVTVPVGDDLERGTRPRPREYAERRIDPGDPVYVLGTARETADGGLEIGADPDGPPFVVVRTDAETARKHARRLCRTFGVLGLLSYGGGLALLASVGL